MAGGKNERKAWLKRQTVKPISCFTGNVVEIFSPRRLKKKWTLDWGFVLITDIIHIYNFYKFNMLSYLMCEVYLMFYFSASKVFMDAPKDASYGPWNPFLIYMSVWSLITFNLQNLKWHFTTDYIQKLI